MATLYSLSVSSKVVSTKESMIWKLYDNEYMNDLLENIFFFECVYMYQGA